MTELATGVSPDALAAAADRLRTAQRTGTPCAPIRGSRITGSNISFADTVADNASSGAYVLGAEHLTLADFEPAAVEMSMTVTDAEDSTGTGAASLGDPVNAVVWLARRARELGEP